METNQTKRLKVSRTSITKSFMAKKKEVINNLKKSNLDPGTKSIIDYFLKLAETHIGKYNFISGQKNVERIIQNIDEDNTTDYLKKCYKFLSTVPDEMFSDIAYSIIQTLEMMRHDILLNKVSELFMSNGYEIRDTDFKLKDYFDVYVDKTPDILLEMNHDLCVIEIKCRKNYNLEDAYQKYKSHIPDTKVFAINYDPAIRSFMFMGDNEHKIENIINNQIHSLDTSLIDDMIDLTTDLRSKYSRYTFFNSLDKGRFDVDFDYFDGITLDDIEGLDSYKEVTKLIGAERWNELLSYLDFNVYENKEKCDEILLNAKDDLINHLSKDYNSFLDVLEETIDNDNYPETDMKIRDLWSYMDKKNSKVYRKTEKCKPSIYMNISTVSSISTTDRTKYYRDIFSKGYLYDKSDRYIDATITLLNDVFCQDFSDTIVNSRNFDHESYEGLNEDYLRMRENPKEFTSAKKMRMKIANFTSNDTSLNVYMNSVFSWNNHYYNKSDLAKYKKKDKEIRDPKKPYLSLSDNKKSLNLFETNMINLSKLDTNLGNVSNIFSQHEIDGEYSGSSLMEDCMKNKFMSHLYTMHSAFKNMLAMSMFNNTKFRLIQTDDPNNFFILLPNADIKDKHPIKYINITLVEKDKLNMSSSDYIQTSKKLGLTHTILDGDTHLISISKPISLDVTRVKILSNSYMKFSILRSYYAKFRKIQDKDIVLSFFLSQMPTIASLSVTENFKNIIMVAYSDYSNIDKLIEDKMECRPTSISHVYIINLMIQGIMSAKSQSMLMKKTRKETYYDENQGKVQDVGFSDINLKLPLSGYDTNSPKEVFHEAYILFYLGNKGLHGSPQEILKLYSVPVKFEREYTEFIKEYESVVQEDTKVKDYGFSYEAMKASSLYTYSKLSGMVPKIRNNISYNMKLNQSPLSVQQFSSTKSMMKYEKIKKPNLEDRNLIYEIDKEITINDFGYWLKHSKYDDPSKFIHDNCLVIKDINDYRRFKKNLERRPSSQIGSFDRTPDKYRDLPLLELTDKGGVKYVTAVGTSFFSAGNINYLDPASSKVMEEFYTYCKDNGTTTVNSLLESLKTIKDDVEIRIFNKNQRTLEDREIYTGNITCRLCLYPIEMVYKSVNECIEQECITTPGDKKHKLMYDQRIKAIKERRNITMMSSNFGRILSLSSDASKWSARDCYIKYLVPILTNPYILESEKLLLLYCFFKYYYKKIILTDVSFLNSMKLYNKDYLEDVYSEMTDSFTKNNWIVRSNWLQGNLNNLSSFVHCCSANTMECLLDIWNNKYKDTISMQYLVHSDDSSYDFVMCMNQRPLSNILRPHGDFFTKDENYGKLLISFLKYCCKLHSITPNEKKTFISQNYKEFLSTLLVGNEIFYFYVSDILPVTSDLTYNSPLDDLASQSSYINNAFSHLCPYNLMQTLICLVNYNTLSTYNLDVNSNKFIARGMPDVDGVKMIDYCTQIYPIYKVPIKLGGLLPYYCGDAIQIVLKFVEVLKNNKIYNSSIPIEDNLSLDNIEFCLRVLSKNWSYYIKSCLLCQDLSIYHNENDEVYKSKIGDLCQTSIITVSPLLNRSKIPKFRSYKDYLESQEDIKKKLDNHPEWILKRPESHDECVISLLGNYSMNSYQNSLCFSNPEMDFARRVMDSNKHIYKLNLPGYDDEVLEKNGQRFQKTRTMQINDLYDSLGSEISKQIITPSLVANYLSIYLLSNKTYSSILFSYITKVESVRVPFTSKPVHLVNPKSIYKGAQYEEGNYNMISKIVIIKDKVDLKPTFYMREFVDYIQSIMEPISRHVKIYEHPEDIDEDFKNYVKMRWSSETPIDFLIKPNQHEDNDMSFKIFQIKLTYQSSLVHNYSEKCKEKIDLKGLLTLMNNYLNKSKTSTKSVLSNVINKPIEAYWLDRFGHYNDRYLYTKYLNEKNLIVLESQNKVIAKENATSTQIRNKILASCLGKNKEFMYELKSGKFNFNLTSHVLSLKDSNVLYENLLYMIYNETEKDYIVNKLRSIYNIYNCWITEESSNDNRDIRVKYQCKNIFMEFFTITEKNSKKRLYCNKYYIGQDDTSVTFRIIQKFNNDLKAWRHNVIFDNFRGRRDHFKSYLKLDKYKCFNFNGEFTLCEIVTHRIGDTINITSKPPTRNVLELTLVFDNKFNFTYKSPIRYDNDDFLSYICTIIKSKESNSYFIEFLCNEYPVWKRPDIVLDLINHLKDNFIKYLFPKTANSVNNDSNFLKIKKYLFKYGSNLIDDHCPKIIKRLLNCLNPMGEVPNDTLYYVVPTIRQLVMPSIDNNIARSIMLDEDYYDIVCKILQMEYGWEDSITMIIISIIRLDRNVFLVQEMDDGIFD